MKRLFTFGCSFTSYDYPTWAEFLALDYDHYENWGIAGTGCRAISERVAECHARNQFGPEDTVIVQWSTHLRHDYFNPMAPKRPYPHGWKTGGNIFNVRNQDVFCPGWVNDFFFEPAYVMHSLNAMINTQSLLKSTGCTWLMTSIGDFRLLGTDLADKNANGVITMATITDNLPEFKFYIDEIWDRHPDHWIQPLRTWADDNPDPTWSFKFPATGKPFQEPHLSPRQYVQWLNLFLRPALGMDQPNPKTQPWLDRIEEGLSPTWTKFLASLGGMTAPSPSIWPHQYRGF